MAQPIEVNWVGKQVIHILLAPKCARMISQIAEWEQTVLLPASQENDLLVQILVFANFREDTFCLKSNEFRRCRLIFEVTFRLSLF